ncbi:hypothetical protein ACFC0K_36250 [Streptomyces hydrogenans]|uniref:hypothetical protein n=1 Tax=Streptomyces hydrogenans TaxID=1873719 RepID=UPI0035DF733D
MPADTPDLVCEAVHYTLPARCTLPSDQPHPWHHVTHPVTGQPLRFRTPPGVRHTQEWDSDNDPAVPESGQWVTWHCVTPQTAPTPLVPDDLDTRAATLASSHEPTHLRRTGPDGPENQCACGTWYPAGAHAAHLGREISLLARGYLDLGLLHAHELPRPDENRWTIHPPRP